MYPSFEELRQNKQRVVFSEEFTRLYWPLRGTFPTALSVMKTMRGALQEMEPLQHGDGRWHEIVSIPLTEPKVSSIHALIPMLDEYEGNWVAWHEYHEAAEYVTNSNLDDNTRPHGEQHEEPLETEPAMGYIVRCCGQDRPEYKDGLTVQVKPAAGEEFVTIYDYVSVVHPWMLKLREDIIQAMTVAGDGTDIRLESARAEDWKISVRDFQEHNILSHEDWLSYHTKPAPLDDATRRKLRAAGARARHGQCAECWCCPCRPSSPDDDDGIASGQGTELNGLADGPLDALVHAEAIRDATYAGRGNHLISPCSRAGASEWVQNTYDPSCDAGFR
ncbi:hypothetical protein LLEC1_03609 [Akanthomyces lecanii]|uniref:Uncharacterized protein n=1 Tax=Cordyceps confragosa TaxID=2714763 RepID=A0A179I718_CORDF|nr:hypothetical protein LLEC1_03609 [Akanthomyces lecanii]